MLDYSSVLDFPGKAQDAATQIKKGAGSRVVKKRTKVHFYKPKTLKLDRKPKYQRKATVSRTKMDNHRIIKFPLTSEVSILS